MKVTFWLLLVACPFVCSVPSAFESSRDRELRRLEVNCEIQELGPARGFSDGSRCSNFTIPLPKGCICAPPFALEIANTTEESPKRISECEIQDALFIMIGDKALTVGMEDYIISADDRLGEWKRNGHVRIDVEGVACVNESNNLLVPACVRMLEIEGELLQVRRRGFTGAITDLILSKDGVTMAALCEITSPERASKICYIRRGIDYCPANLLGLVDSLWWLVKILLAVLLLIAISVCCYLCYRCHRRKHETGLSEESEPVELETLPEENQSEKEPEKEILTASKLSPDSEVKVPK